MARAPALAKRRKTSRVAHRTRLARHVDARATVPGAIRLTVLKPAEICEKL